MTTPEPTSPPRPPRWSTDRLLAFSAVFLSLAALVVAIFQTAILREQQRASAWPFLQVASKVDNDVFSYSLYNFGVGPARILEVGFAVGDSAVAGSEAFVRGVVEEMGGVDSLGGFGWYWAEIRAGEVIPVAGEVQLMQTLNSYPLLRRMDGITASDSFHLSVRYADVYGNEWLLRDGAVTEL